MIGRAKCVRICLQFGISAVLIAVQTGSVVAEELKTSGEFLIEPAIGAVGGEAAVDALLRANGARLAQRLNRGQVLKIRPNVAAVTAGSASSIRDVEPGDLAFCKSMIDAQLARSCSPDYVVKASAVPNDSYMPQLWGMNNGPGGMNAVSAWDVGTGASSVVVAVVDTGIDYTHPDLATNIWVNTGEVAGNGIDDDGNGYIDDIHGYNAAANSGDPYDNNGHGTHVAGTIGARGNNGVGVAGTNWQVKVMGLKFLNANGSGTLSDAIEALEYVITMKQRGVNIRVANNSWGGGGFSQPLYNVIAEARAAGIVFVAAAGNEGNDNDAQPSYPASYDLDNVVSVAALDSSGNLAGFSNYGATEVDIAAPGVAILSTVPGGAYQSLSGTSMASPHVAGALALLAAVDPALTYQELITRLYDSGAGMTTLQGLVRTSRRVELNRMLRNLTTPIPPPPVPTGPCSYVVSTIPYSPDTAADDQPVLIRGDELNYQTLNLPFGFPFKGGEVWAAKLSLNGVIYLKSAPSGMDYRNTAVAPQASIAALHTDLVSALPNEGIRVYSSNDKVVVSWVARHYMKQGAGASHVRTVLRSNGVIENYIEHATNELAQFVNGEATVGINGQGASNFETVPTANAGNNLAVRFTPQCGAETPDGAVVESATAAGLIREDELRPFGIRGRPFTVHAQGQGEGDISLEISINGVRCQQSSQISMTAGVADMWGVVPSKKDISLIRFTLVGADGKKIITKLRIKKSGATKAKARLEKRRLSSRTHLRVCERVANSLS